MSECLMAQYYSCNSIWQWEQRTQLQIYNLAPNIRCQNLCYSYKTCRILDCAPDLR